MGEGASPDYNEYVKLIGEAKDSFKPKGIWGFIDRHILHTNHEPEGFKKVEVEQNMDNLTTQSRQRVGEDKQPERLFVAGRGKT